MSSGSNSVYLSPPSSQMEDADFNNNSPVRVSGAPVSNASTRSDHFILVNGCCEGKDTTQGLVQEQMVNLNHAVDVEVTTALGKVESTLELNSHVVKLEGGMVMQPDVVRCLMAKMDTMSAQIRDLQLLILQGTLTSQNLARSPESFASVKNVQLLQPKDQVFQTPKKSQEPLSRLDVTPESLPSEVDHQNGGSSTVTGNSRRSLAFPNSLKAVLERSKENCFSNNSTRRVSKDASERDEPMPKLSLVDIKVQSTRSNSPNRGDSKLGLLVLADAALTRVSGKPGFGKAGESFLDYDSGLSSGNSCRSSPSVSQDIIANTRTEKFTRYGMHNNSCNSPQKTSSSLSRDAKMRKRRKTKQPLPCNFCGKCFNNQSSLRQHESFHRPTRPFKCENEKCDKAYKTRSELNRHLVVHSGEKKHECKLCGKRFLRKQYLKTHLLRHHETGLAMVAPSAIDSFKDASTGAIPSIVVSSSLVSKTEPLTWRCQMCFKIFVNEEDLTRHIRSYHEKKKTDGKTDIDSSRNNRLEEEA